MVWDSDLPTSTSEPGNRSLIPAKTSDETSVPATNLRETSLKYLEPKSPARPHTVLLAHRNCEICIIFSH